MQHRMLDELLLARDKLSCQQRGAAGPPFAAAAQLTLGRAFARWLPWNWFSLDGTGWCYDGEWDELLPCEELRAPVDWNGVSSSRGSDDVPIAAPRALEALLVAFLAFAAALRLAHSPAVAVWVV